MQLFQELEKRRRELGMSRATLAQRSHVSLPTVNRIMSQQHQRPTFAHVAAIADVLGVELTPVPKAKSEELRQRQARNKARQLVGLIQGSSGLEGQALDKAELDSLVAQAAEKLLRSKRKLWAE